MSSWKVRDPAVFPVHYSDTLMLAWRSDKPALLGLCFTQASARKTADHFREWRYCLRHRGSSAHRCYEIERDYTIKLCAVKSNFHETEIWVSVHTRLLSNLARLNPDLADLIPPNCQ